MTSFPEGEVVRDKIDVEMVRNQRKWDLSKGGSIKRLLSLAMRTIEDGIGGRKRKA